MGQAIRKLFDTFFGNTEMRVRTFSSPLVSTLNSLFLLTWPILIILLACYVLVLISDSKQ